MPIADLLPQTSFEALPPCTGTAGANRIEPGADAAGDGHESKLTVLPGGEECAVCAILGAKMEIPA